MSKEPTAAESAYSRLESDGWHLYLDQFRRDAKCYHKRFETPTCCHANHNKPGMQVCIPIHTWQEHMGCSVELTGELQDGTWIKLQNYSFGHDIESAIAAVPRLLTTWEHIANK